MKKETRRQISLSVVIPVIAAIMIFMFVAGVFVGQNVSSKSEEDIFMEGIMAGMDFVSLNLLHENGGLSDEDYEVLNEALETYIEDPSKENREMWYHLYQSKLTEMIS